MPRQSLQSGFPAGKLGVAPGKSPCPALRVRVSTVRPAGAQPTQLGPAEKDRVFWSVIVPTAMALLLCNMDRIVMSIAILPIAREFGWAPSMQVPPPSTPPALHSP